jgi:hypothetical protein
MAKDKTGGMRNLAQKTKDEVDVILQEKEIAMLKRTSVNMEKLRPNISDEASFNKLIEAVETATRKNESIAQLQKRIVDLGKGVFDVAKEVLTLLS